MAQENNEQNLITHANSDAWSHGQITSKLWLCEKIEQYWKNKNSAKIWILGGWYGITAFLLLSRNNIKIDQVRSFDVDPNCEAIADAINNNWLINEWTFKAMTVDCNYLEYSKEKPDIVINTSTEHFSSLEWWNRIPTGQFVALQGNNMPHSNHCFLASSFQEFVDRFPLDACLYSGSKYFQYPNLSFDRYMIVGCK